MSRLPAGTSVSGPTNDEVPIACRLSRLALLAEPIPLIQMKKPWP